MSDADADRDQSGGRRRTRKNTMHQLNGALGGTKAFVAARTVLTHRQAERQQQILDQAAGRLVDRGEALDSFCRILSDLRTRMLAVPASAAREANPGDPATALEAIRKAVGEALESFDADAIQRAMDREATS
jgi:hypothetical protein